MGKLRNRSEVAVEDKWKVETIYENNDLFYQELEQIKEEIKKIEKLKDNFLTQSDKFKELILLDDNISRKIEKAYCYANLKSSEDMADNTSQELVGHISNLYHQYEEAMAFFTPSILKEDKEKILSFLEKEKDLAPYRHMIESLLRYQGHTLSEEEEKIIAAFSKVLSAGSDAADYLMDADMRFGTIKDENGCEVELTQSNYSNYIRSKDRRVRKETFKKFHEVFGSYKNTLTTTLSSVVQSSSTSARLNHFASSLESALYGNKIPTSMYYNLISSTHKYLPLLYRYFDIKKEVLGVDEFHLYDGYVNTIEGIGKKYSFEEGKKLVLNALSVLGEEYITILKTAFTDGWIDKYPNRGKASGAYSSGTYDTLPFVLLNYTDKFDDVSTLAHELGHSIHSYFSTHYNEHINSSYPIFLAEIASTVNELLFSYYMEKQCEDKNEKLAILNERLDLFKATIFRQTMFAEFELHIHEMVDKKEILTPEELCKYYYDLNKLYFGDRVVVDDEIRYEWLRIPHFYRVFYVYQYATGLSIASYIVKNILENKEGFVEKYIEFLKSGGRDYPLEVLKIIDVDLQDTKVFDEAMEMFKETLDTFEKLNKEK